MDRSTSPVGNSSPLVSCGDPLGRERGGGPVRGRRFGRIEFSAALIADLCGDRPDTWERLCLSVFFAFASHSVRARREGPLFLSKDAPQTAPAPPPSSKPPSQPSESWPPPQEALATAPAAPSSSKQRSTTFHGLGDLTISRGKKTRGMGCFSAFPHPKSPACAPFHSLLCASALYYFVLPSFLQRLSFRALAETNHNETRRRWPPRDNQARDTYLPKSWSRSVAANSSRAACGHPRRHIACEASANTNQHHIHPSHLSSRERAGYDIRQQVPWLSKPLIPQVSPSRDTTEVALSTRVILGANLVGHAYGRAL